MVGARSKEYKLNYSNYNSSFLFFHDNYIQLCTSIMKTKNLDVIYRKIYVFVDEFSYALDSSESWTYYKSKLDSIKADWQTDSEFVFALRKDDLSVGQQLQLAPRFFRYVMEMLKVLGEYNTDLTSVYFPRMSHQEATILYENNLPFFEKLQEFKRIVVNNLSDFSIGSFFPTFNSVMTLCYAYITFINADSLVEIETEFKACIEVFNDSDFQSIIMNFNSLSHEQKEALYGFEETILKRMSFVNGLINEGFSYRGITPKKLKKTFFDNTLI